MVLGDRKHLAWRKRFLGDENSIRLLSVVGLSLAALTLKYQSIITPDGEGIVVFVAWLALLEGILMALTPAWYVRMKAQAGKALVKNESGQMFWGVIWVLAGAFFTYMGMVLV